MQVKVTTFAAGGAVTAEIDSNQETFTLLRDTARTVQVAVIRPPAAGPSECRLLVLPWTPGALRLSVNDVCYDRGPVELADGDSVRLCRPGAWTDDVHFDMSITASAVRASSHEGNSAGVPRNTSEEVGKWSNYYTYRYSSLDAGEGVPGEPRRYYRRAGSRRGQNGGGGEGGAPQMMIVTVLEDTHDDGCADGSGSGSKSPPFPASSAHGGCYCPYMRHAWASGERGQQRLRDYAAAAQAIARSVVADFPEPESLLEAEAAEAAARVAEDDADAKESPPVEGSEKESQVNNADEKGATGGRTAAAAAPADDSFLSPWGSYAAFKEEKAREQLRWYHEQHPEEAAEDTLDENDPSYVSPQVQALLDRIRKLEGLLQGPQLV